MSLNYCPTIIRNVSHKECVSTCHRDWQCGEVAWRFMRNLKIRENDIQFLAFSLIWNSGFLSKFNRHVDPRCWSMAEPSEHSRGCCKWLWFYLIFSPEKSEELIPCHQYQNPLNLWCK